MFDRGYNGKLWGTRGVDAYTPRPRGGIVTGCSRKFLPTRNSLNNYARPADDDDDARPTTPILPSSLGPLRHTFFHPRRITEFWLCVTRVLSILVLDSNVQVQVYIYIYI